MDVPAKVALLTSTDAAARAGALLEIGKSWHQPSLKRSGDYLDDTGLWKPNVIASLVKFLGEKSTTAEKKAAANVLCALAYTDEDFGAESIKDERAINPLVKLLRHHDVELKTIVARTLAAYAFYIGDGPCGMKIAKSGAVKLLAGIVWPAKKQAAEAREQPKRKRVEVSLSDVRAGKEVKKRFVGFGEHFGKIFQVQNDEVDVLWGDGETTKMTKKEAAKCMESFLEAPPGRAAPDLTADAERSNEQLKGCALRALANIANHSTTPLMKADVIPKLMKMTKKEFCYHRDEQILEQEAAVVLAALAARKKCRAKLVAAGVVEALTDLWNKEHGDPCDFENEPVVKALKHLGAYAKSLEAQNAKLKQRLKKYEDLDDGSTEYDDMKVADLKDLLRKQAKGTGLQADVSGDKAALIARLRAAEDTDSD